MGKPVERQNLSLPFFALAVLIALATAWAFWDEFVGRRPWKGYQEQILDWQRERTAAGLRFYERRLEAGDLKLADPQHPDQVITAAEARQRLAAMDQALAQRRGELDRIAAARRAAGERADDADLQVKLLQSEEDGLFYDFQHALQTEMLSRERAARLQAGGKAEEAEAAAKEADSEHRRVQELQAKRQEKRAQISAAEARAAQAAKERSELDAQREAIAGDRDRLAAALEGALDPLLTAKRQLEAAAAKRTELTQYWLTSWDSSVDRCQNCHASVDQCGYSRPSELLSALAAPNANAEQLSRSFCVDRDTLGTYQGAAAELCAVRLDAEASRKGQIASGECLRGEIRKRARERVRSYCGDASPLTAVLSDERLPAACVGAAGWARLGPYVLDAQELGLCDLELGAQGEACIEGARRDFLIEQLRRDCRGGRALPALEKEKRACALGDDGKRLAAFRPVLYAYPVWAQTHPWRQELLGPNHPPDRFGCTSCHEGQGAQTKGVGNRPFAHGYDDPYWERPLLDLVSHEKYRPASWGPPPPTGVPGEIATHERSFVQSSCAKCHSEEVTLRFGDTYAQGRQLAAELGCQGCHPIEALKDSPKIGPSLTRLREKTTPAFLLTWLAYPKAFRPRTRMPNFWPEALDAALHLRKGSPEEKLRSDEVRKIAASLWRSSLPEQLPAPPARGDAKRGGVLAQSLGCRGCHTFTPPETFCTQDQVAQGRSHGTPEQPGACEVARSLPSSAARSLAPNLSNEGLKTNARWLFAWLKDPPALWPQARMPSLRLSDQEAADLSAYLMTLKSGAAPEGDGLFAGEGSAAFLEAARQGDALVTKYGCAGCHDIPGHEKDAKNGADLNAFGRKSVELMDFGNAIPNPRQRTWYDFTDLKLRAPRAFTYERVETRMPQYDFDDPEVEATMIFLRSRTGERVPPAFDVAQVPRLSSMAQGDQVLTWFNCRGCHVIDGRGGDLRDIYTDDDVYKAPPVLQMEGWRTQPGWLFAFLRSPVPQLRPWLTARMPTFPLGDARDTTLVRSFAASANVTYPYLTVSPKPLEGARLKEAEALFTEFKCLSCHTRGKPPPGTDPQALAPDMELAATRLRPDWVLEWIRVPQQLQEGTRMPQYFGGEDLSAVMYPKYFGGSQARQIEALRDYVMAMGVAKAAAQASR